MKQVADTIRGMGMKPGITVDPLKIARGAAEWTALTDDGTRWLNPSTPKGREAGIDQLKGLVAMGYKFFVVERSLIPDGALRHFNMTRAEADLLAFEIMAAAADGWPCFLPRCCSCATTMTTGSISRPPRPGSPSIR
jgi:hypothetical protein